jgi:rubredoxin
VAGGNAIRGSRVGAGPSGETERGDSAPRQFVTYFCASGHETGLAFSTEADVPETWDCPRCGKPAGQVESEPPTAARTGPYKTHLAYVKERRSDAEGAALLDEALTRLKQRRGQA